MPITLTTQELLDSAQSLRELSDMPVPVRTALKLRKIYKVTQKDLETTQELIQDLSKRHAKKDAAGNIIHPVIRRGENGEKDVVDESKAEIADREAFQKDYDAIMDEPLEIAFDKIKVEDLTDPKDPPLKLKTALVFALDWLLEG